MVAISMRCQLVAVLLLGSGVGLHSHACSTNKHRPSGVIYISYTIFFCHASVCVVEKVENVPSVSPTTRRNPAMHAWQLDF